MSTVSQKPTAHLLPSTMTPGAASGFISPDMILQYVANRLHSTDGQMQDLMKRQGDMEREGAILSELAGIIGDGTWQQKGVVGKEDADKVIAAYDAAIKQAGGDKTPLGAKLAAAKQHAVDSRKYNGTDTDVMSNDEMRGYLQEINRLQSDLSRGGEMMMMKLQSLASQRQQIIQFATNTIAGLGESAKAIAANTGK